MISLPNDRKAAAAILCNIKVKSLAEKLLHNFIKKLHNLHVADDGERLIYDDALNL